jgi:hypothetical protein
MCSKSHSGCVTNDLRPSRAHDHCSPLSTQSCSGQVLVLLYSSTIFSRVCKCSVRRRPLRPLTSWAQLSSQTIPARHEGSTENRPSPSRLCLANDDLGRVPREEVSECVQLSRELNRDPAVNLPWSQRNGSKSLDVTLAHRPIWTGKCCGTRTTIPSACVTLRGKAYSSPTLGTSPRGKQKKSGVLKYSRK